MLVVGLGRVHPGSVLWEVLMAVHGVVGHHLDLWVVFRRRAPRRRTVGTRAIECGGCIDTR